MDLSNTHTNTNDIINYNKTTELIEAIFNFKDKNNFEGDMVSLIISYCDENGFRIEEVGDILSESKDFTKMLEKQAIKTNHFQVPETDNDRNQIDEDEW